MIVKKSYLLLLTVLVILAGCRDRTQVTVSDIRPRETNSDHLQQALQIIDGLDFADLTHATNTSIVSFNLWSKLHDDDPEWVYQTLIHTAPPELDNSDFVQAIGGKRFIPSDINYLHETSWLNAIAQWVVADDLPHRMFWESYKPTIADEVASEELTKALKLFDWTVRNIQLAPLLDDPTIPTNTEGPVKISPQLALPGPGYSRTNRHVLTLGVGDWWQRARIFVLLARQQGIDVVLLGLPAEFGKTNQPWLTAAIIGKELYLFDFNKGLPVLNAAKTEIVTLKQLKADVDFGQTLLPVAHQQQPQKTFDGLVGLIEADVFAVSHRMAILEKYLTGERQMVLTVAPNIIAKRLRTVHQIELSKIWQSIYKGYLFEAALYEKLVAQDAAALEFDASTRDYSLFREVPQLREGRFKFLRGAFDDDETDLGVKGENGAKTLMMASRIPTKLIEELLENEGLQQSLGLLKPNNTPVLLWRQALINKQRTFVRAKDYASFYIAMIHMEQGHYQDAIEWFERRTIMYTNENAANSKGKEDTPSVNVATNNKAPAGQPTVNIQDILSGNSLTNGVAEDISLTRSAFHDLALYNLARCYIALDQQAAAAELLQDSESEQQTGDQQLSKLLQE
jgi:tetratricopeptide (TPR) repeat protein